MEKLAVVGIFFDGYYDIWEDFLELYKRFFSNTNYQLYIVNNSIDLKSEKNNVKIIHAGEDAEYSRKIQCALEQIEARKLLLVLEDFFFTEEFPDNVLQQVISFMDDNNLLYYSMPLPEFAKAYHGTSYKGYSYLQNIESNSEYTVCCQPAVWDRDFLKDCIGKANYNAWIFEGVYSKSQYAHTEEFRKKCVVDVRNILGLRHGALQGKMIQPTIETLNAMGYHLKTNREIMTNREYARYLSKQWIKTLVPVSLQKKIKSIIKTDSVIERYSSDIEKIMKEIGID